MADAAITLKDAPAEKRADPGALAFDTDVLAGTAFSYVVGDAIDALELPDVKGGGDLKTYSVSATCPLACRLTRPRGRFRVRRRRLRNQVTYTVDSVIPCQAWLTWYQD